MKTKIYLLVCTSILIWALHACNSSPYAQGERLYSSYCQNCHMADGTGLRNLIPPLSGADYLKNHPKKVACLIKNGIADTIIVNGTIYQQEMPAYPELTEAQIANIINYINNSWDNSIGFTPLDSVFQWLNECKEY